MTVGELSTIMAIFPSSTWAAMISGLWVYLTFGNGLNLDNFFPVISSTRVCSVTVNPSVFRSLSMPSIFCTMSISALFFIYATDTSDLVISPMEYILNIRSLSLIRLLTSAILVIMDSTKPSLEPLRLFSFEGSSTPLSG